MNIEQLLAKQKRIADLIEAARKAEKRLGKLNSALLANPAILDKLTNEQIIAVLNAAIENASTSARSVV